MPVALMILTITACGSGSSRSTCADPSGSTALPLAHLVRYPLMEIPDAFKLLQQATMGSEHAVRDSSGPQRWMEREWATLGEGPPELLVDTLGTNGRFARVHLRAWRAAGGAPTALVRAFVATAGTSEPDTAALRCAIDGLIRLAQTGKAPWTADSVDAAARAWGALGYPAVDHSAPYESAYRPAYRVVALSLIAGLLETR